MYVCCPSPEQLKCNTQPFERDISVGFKTIPFHFKYFKKKLEFANIIMFLASFSEVFGQSEGVFRAFVQL